MSNAKKVRVSDIESLLVCLPGIQKARVVINDWGAIEEVHILTGLRRNPKQIVRDVQSALKAQWDITLDRRKVSVAQVRAGSSEQVSRLRYCGLDLKTDGRTGRTEISVTLDRTVNSDRIAYVGKAHADISESSTLMGVARATGLAANQTLEPPNAFSIEDVCMIQMGTMRAVAVLLSLLTPRRNHEQMVGCALVRRDLLEACVRATLDGMNRRLEVLPRRGDILRAGDGPEGPEPPEDEATSKPE